MDSTNGVAIYPFTKYRSEIEKEVIHSFEKSSDYADIKERFHKIINIADRLYLSALSNKHLRDLHRRIQDKFSKFGECMNNYDFGRNWGCDFIMNCIEPYLKLLLSNTNRVSQITPDDRHIALFSVLISSGIILQSELEKNLDKINEINDPVKKNIIITYRIRNQDIHWAPDKNPSMNPLVSVLITLLAAIDKNIEDLNRFMSGLIVSHFSSNTPIEMLRLVNNEFLDHVNRFKGHEKYVNDISKIIVEQVNSEGKYFILVDQEETGKSATACRIAEVISRNKYISGSNASSVKRIAPWIPGVILHLGKQSNNPIQIVNSIVSQANTMLINKIEMSNCFCEQDFVTKIEESIDDDFVSDKLEGNIFPFDSSSKQKNLINLDRNKDVKELEFLVYDALSRLVEERGEAFLIIDSLDEISPNANKLNFLPAPLPRGAVCLLTSRNEREIINFAISKLKAIDLGFKRIDLEDIKLITNINDDDWNNKLYVKTDGIPGQIWYFTNKIKEIDGAYKDIDLTVGPTEIFEYSILKWKLDLKDNSQDPLWMLLPFLAVFENVGSVKTELCQSYLEFNKYKTTNYHLKQILNKVSSQLYGLSEGSIKLATKSFGEYVLKQVLGGREIDNALAIIVDWIAQEEFISMELVANFLLYWTDESIIEVKNHCKTVMSLLEKMIDNNSSEKMEELYCRISSRDKEGETLSNLAKNILEKCSKADFHWASLYLGTRLLRGKGIVKNIDKGENILITIANKGNADAMFLLGAMYKNGLHLKKDNELGIEWLHKAAKENNPAALSILGLELIQNNKDEIEFIKGKEMIELSADLGDDDSMFLLGTLYLEGKEFEKDILKGEDWLVKSAKEGNIRAMTSLGVRLVEGRDLIKNKDEGKKWLEKAAHANDSYVMNYLGIMLLEGNEFPKDTVQGEKYIRNSIELGNTDAMYLLGSHLIDGTVIKKNLVEGKKLLRRAAKEGNTKAMLTLGTMLINGDELERNLDEGKKWLQLASNRGNIDAMISLGARLVEGEKLDKNIEEGEKLLRLAAEKKNPEAMYQIAIKILENILSAEYDGEAFELLERAGNDGHVLSKLRFLLIPFEYQNKEINQNNTEPIFKYIDTLNEKLTVSGFALYCLALRKKNNSMFYKLLLRLAANIFNRAFEIEQDENAGNSLAYLSRRGELFIDNRRSIDEYLTPGLKSGHGFCYVNNALRYAVGFEAEVDWKFAEENIIELRKLDYSAEEIKYWWHSRAIEGDPEGHLVIGWLCKHSLIKDPDNMTVEDRFKLAEKGCFDIPSWMYGN